MKRILCALALGLASVAFGQSPSVTWNNQDIGTTGVLGTYTLDSASGTFTVQGGGADIWGVADAFQFVYTPMSGDGTFTAHVVSQGNTNAWAKAGVMLRETVAPGSAYAAMFVTPGNGLNLQYRASTGGGSISVKGPAIGIFGAFWLRIARSGNQFTASVSQDGTAWVRVGNTVTVTMAAAINAGFAVSSHVAGTLGPAVFDQVTLSATAVPPPGPMPPTNVLISGIEPLTNTDGSRIRPRGYLLFNLYEGPTPATLVMVGNNLLPGETLVLPVTGGPCFSATAFEYSDPFDPTEPRWSPTESAIPPAGCKAPAFGASQYAVTLHIKPW